MQTYQRVNFSKFASFWSIILLKLGLFTGCFHILISVIEMSFLKWVPVVVSVLQRFSTGSFLNDHQTPNLRNVTRLLGMTIRSYEYLYIRSLSVIDKNWAFIFLFFFFCHLIPSFLFHFSSFLFSCCFFYCKSFQRDWKQWSVFVSIKLLHGFWGQSRCYDTF